MTADQNDAGGKAEKMKESPVLFNGAMVRAILDDRKTQTRRPLKPHLQHVEAWRTDGHGRFYGVSRLATTGGLGVPETDFIESPLGKPGDRLWVRETFGFNHYDDGHTRAWKRTIYRADGLEEPSDNGSSAPWRPSIHMPRRFARLFLDVVDVRIERLQDITEKDARAEGADRNEGKWVDEDGRTRSSYRLAFRRLWILVYGAESWAANPWVWVTKFKRVT